MEINHEQALKWLTDILKIPSVEGKAENGAPFGKDVNDCLLYALGLLKKLNFTVKNVDGYCGYGEIGNGELFAVLCHLDVVPVGEGWTYPPFGAEIHNNKVYARGALDDKGPFICALYAAAKLIDEGYKPTKRIRFILGCDEESGWKCMERYAQTEEMPVMGISPDSDFPVINCEKGIVYHTIIHKKPDFVKEIEGGQRANMVPDTAYAIVSNCERILNILKNQEDCSYEIIDGNIKINAKGKSAHGSHPEEGDNAIIKILKILSFYNDFQYMYNAFNDYNGKNIKLNLRDKQSGNLTLNLGTVKNTDKEIIYELDIRHPITYNKDQITEILSKNLKCKVEQGFYHLPLYVPEEHFLVKTLLGAYNKVMKTNAKPICIGGGTYARMLPLGVAFGPVFPGSEAKIHCVDEYISLEDFNKAIEIYYEAFKELLFEKN